MYPLITAIFHRNIEAIEALLAAIGMGTMDAPKFSKKTLNLDCVPQYSRSSSAHDSAEMRGLIEYDVEFTPWKINLLSCLVDFDQLPMVQH